MQELEYGWAQFKTTYGWSDTEHIFFEKRSKKAGYTYYQKWCEPNDTCYPTERINISKENEFPQCPLCKRKLAKLIEDRLKS